MNKTQKDTFDTLIGKESNGNPTYTGKFTIDEMNKYLVEAQNDLKRVTASGNEKSAKRLNDEIVGIAAALVHASNPRNQPW